MWKLQYVDILPIKYSFFLPVDSKVIYYIFKENMLHLDDSYKWSFQIEQVFYIVKCSFEYGKMEAQEFFLHAQYKDVVNSK